MTVSVRPYDVADAGAAAAIYRAEVVGGVATFELEPPSVEDMADRLGRIGQTYPVLVAVRGSTVVGFAYAARFRDRAAFSWTAEDSIYVAADVRGLGVGRRLLDALLAECADRGLRQMIAVIGGSDNLASRRLHEAAGFTTVGVHRAVGWKLGRWVDTVVMQRAIGAGASAPP